MQLANFLHCPPTKIIKTILIAGQSQDPENRMRLQAGSKNSVCSTGGKKGVETRDAALLPVHTAE